MTEEIKDEAQEVSEVEVSEDQDSSDEVNLKESSGECEGSPDENKEEEPQKEEIDWKDKYLRLHADWENFRKRMDEQRADERARATENLIRDLIPLVDDMHHALDYAAKNEGGDLVEGFTQISTKFWSSLEKHGLREIDPAGEPFDPIMHQAVSTVEDTSVFDETVKDVYQKGYQLGIKVIRPAMVTITTGGKKRPKDVEAQDQQGTASEEEVKNDKEKQENEEE